MCNALEDVRPTHEEELLNLRQQLGARNEMLVRIEDHLENYLAAIGPVVSGGKTEQLLKDIRLTLRPAATSGANE